MKYEPPPPIRLRERGYDAIITQRRYSEIERRWHEQHPSAFEAALRPLMADADDAQRRALAVAIDFGRRMSLEMMM